MTLVHVSRSTYFPSATLGYRKQRGHPGMRTYPDIMEAQVANVRLPTITLQLTAFLTAADCIQFHSESHDMNDAALTKIYSSARSTCKLNAMTKLTQTPPPCPPSQLPISKPTSNIAYVSRPYRVTPHQRSRDNLGSEGYLEMIALRRKPIAGRHKKPRVSSATPRF